MDGCTEVRTDKASYRVACPQINTIFLSALLVEWRLFNFNDCSCFFVVVLFSNLLDFFHSTYPYLIDTFNEWLYLQTSLSSKGVNFLTQKLKKKLI